MEQDTMVDGWVPPEVEAVESSWTPPEVKNASPQSNIPTVTLSDQEVAGGKPETNLPIPSPSQYQPRLRLSGKDIGLMQKATDAAFSTSDIFKGEKGQRNKDIYYSALLKQGYTPDDISLIKGEKEGFMYGKPDKPVWSGGMTAETSKLQVIQPTQELYDQDLAIQSYGGKKNYDIMRSTIDLFITDDKYLKSDIRQAYYNELENKGIRLTQAFKNNVENAVTKEKLIGGKSEGWLGALINPVGTSARVAREMAQAGVESMIKGGEMWEGGASLPEVLPVGAKGLAEITLGVMSATPIGVKFITAIETAHKVAPKTVDVAMTPVTTTREHLGMDEPKTETGKALLWFADQAVFGLFLGAGHSAKKYGTAEYKKFVDNISGETANTAMKIKELSQKYGQLTPEQKANAANLWADMQLKKLDLEVEGLPQGQKTQYRKELERLQKASRYREQNAINAEATQGSIIPPVNDAAKVVEVVTVKQQGEKAQYEQVKVELAEPEAITQPSIENVSKEIAPGEAPKHFEALTNYINDFDAFQPINEVASGISVRYQGRNGRIGRSETGEVTFTDYSNGKTEIITGGGDATPFNQKGLSLNEGTYKDANGEYFVQGDNKGYTVYEVKNGTLKKVYDGENAIQSRKDAIIRKALGKSPLTIEAEKAADKVLQLQNDWNKSKGTPAEPILAATLEMAKKEAAIKSEEAIVEQHAQAMESVVEVELREQIEQLEITSESLSDAGKQAIAPEISQARTILKEMEAKNEVAPEATMESKPGDPIGIRPQEAAASLIPEPPKSTTAPEGDGTGIKQNSAIISGDDVYEMAKKAGSENGDITDIEEIVKRKDYQIAKVSIKELIKNDEDLREFLNTEKPRQKGRKIETPIIVADVSRGGDIQKSGVVDGFHRISQAIANGESNILAYVESDSYLLNNKKATPEATKEGIKPVTNEKTNEKGEQKRLLTEPTAEPKTEPVSSLSETTKQKQEAIQEQGAEGIAYTAEVGGAKSKGVYLADEGVAKSYGEEGAPIVKYKYKLKNPLIIEKDVDFDVVNKLINDYKKENPNAKFHPDITDHINKELEKLGYDGLIIKKEALDTEKGYNDIGGTYGEPQIVVFDRKSVSVETPTESPVNKVVKKELYRVVGMPTNRKGKDFEFYGDENVANEYAAMWDNTTVIKKTVEYKNPLKVDLIDEQFSDPQYESKYLEQAKREGYDAVIFKNKETGQEHYAILKNPIKTPIEKSVETPPEPSPKQPVEAPPQAKPLTSLEQAKEKLRAAKEAANKLRDVSKLGTMSDPFKRAEEQAKADRKMHEAYIEVAIEYLKDKTIKAAKTLENFAKYLEEEITDTIKTAWEDAVNKQMNPRVSGIKKALVPDEKILQTDINRRATDDVINAAKDRMKSGENKAEEIISQIVDGGDKALQPNEVADLIVYKVKLDNDMLRANEVLAAAKERGSQAEISLAQAVVSALNKKRSDYETMSVRTAYEQSLAFRLRKELLDSEYSAVRQIAKLKGMAKDGYISPDMVNKVKDLETKIKAIIAEKEAIEEKLKEYPGNEAYEKLKAEFEKEKAKQKGTTTATAKTKEWANKVRKLKTTPFKFVDEMGVEHDISTMGATWNGLVENVAKAIEEGGVLADKITDILKDNGFYKNLSDSDKAKFEKQLIKAAEDFNTDAPKEARPPEVKNGKIVINKQLLKDIIEAGARDINELTKAVHDLIKDEHPDITEREVRDAITQYGKQRFLNKEELETKLREYKRIGLKLSQLEDVQNKKRPLKTGMERDKMTQYERKLLKDIKELLKELPEDEAAIQQKWKSTQDAITTRLNNRIADIKAQIEKGERFPSRNPVVYNETNKALRKEADELQSVLDELVGKTERTPEQRVKTAIKQIEAQEREIEKNIRDNNLGKKTVTPVPETPELKAARDRLKAKKEILNKMREDQGIVEKERLDLFKKRKDDAIKKYQDRINAGDFAPKEKKPGPTLDQQALDKEVKLQQVKEEFLRLQEVQRLKNRTWREVLVETATDLGGGFKTLKASLDLSAAGRQGLPLGLRNPKAAGRAFKIQFEHAFSKEAHERWLSELKTKPLYALMQKSKLFLAEPHTKQLAKEEMFTSKMVEKIPIYGKLVAGSERAYTGYLNSLRVDVFTKLADQLDSQGKTFENNPQAYKDIANLINVLSGRGDMGKLLEGATPLLSSPLGLFSPRYVASRFNFLDPRRYLDPKVDKVARQEMIKTAATFVGTGLSILTMAKLAGADVETDPRSSDFWKIKIGDKRIDVFAGYAQVASFIAREILGSTKKQSGDVKELDSGEFGAEGRGDIAIRFLRTKLAPLSATLANLITGKDVTGQAVTPAGEALGLITPLATSDIYDLYKKEGVGWALALTPAIVFGIPAASYGPKDQINNPVAQNEGGNEVNILGETIDDRFLTSNLQEKKQQSKIWQFIEKNNVLIPKLRDTYTKDGESKTMTPDEFYEYAKRAGEKTKEGLLGLINNGVSVDGSLMPIEKATHEQMKKGVKKVVDNARDEAKSELFGDGDYDVTETSDNQVEEEMPEPQEEFKEEFEQVDEMIE